MEVLETVAGTLPARQAGDVDAARPAPRLDQMRGVQARVVIGPRVTHLANAKESRRVADVALRALDRMPHVRVSKP